MANNEYINKVLFGDTTVMDISDTTAEEGDVIEGRTFYARSGAPAMGSLGDATTSTHGLMSVSDKIKLDNIDEIQIYETIDTPADVMSFSDGVDDMPMVLTVGIEPVQDLHGQSNPWPAGGGVNLLENQASSLTRNGITCTVNNDGTMELNGTCTSATPFIIGTVELESTKEYILSGCPTGGSINSYHLLIYKSGTSENYIDTGNGVTVNPQSNGEYEVEITVLSGASLDQAIFKPMVRLSSVTDATYAPYSNICSIGGWTGCNISRTGKNLIPDGKDTSKGYVANRFLSYNGNLNASSTDYYVSEYFRVVPGANYVWGLGSGISETGKNNPSMCFYDANKDFIIGIQMSYIVSHPGVVPENAVYARSSQVKNPVTTVPFIFEYGTEATPYEDYNSDSATYSVAFPSSAGTVYGGELTVNKDGTGTLVVDRSSVDLGTLSWTAHGTYSNIFYATVNGMQSASDDRNTGIICSQYPPDKQTTIGDIMHDKTMLRYTLSRLFIKDSSYTDAASFKSAMSGVQFVYVLGTPVTYQLSDLEVIETLKGINNIWADTGKINEVEYTHETAGLINTQDKIKLDSLSTNSNIATLSETQAMIDDYYGGGN